MSSEPSDNPNELPWIGIAILMIVVGVAVTVMLSLADPPPPPTAPEQVQHQHPDLGDWAPFADVGDDASDGSSDALWIGD